MNKGNTILVVAAILTLILLALLGSSYNRKRTSAPQSLSCAAIEKIKNIKELHLINYRFEQRIDIHKKDDPAKDMEAVLLVPVQINTGINIGRVSFIMSGDSSTIQKIILPHSDYSAMQIMADSDKLKQFLVFGSADDAKLWESVKAQTKNTDKAILDKADSMHLLPKADSDAVIYLQSVLDSIKYKRIPITFQNIIKD